MSVVCRVVVWNQVLSELNGGPSQLEFEARTEAERNWAMMPLQQVGPFWETASETDNLFWPLQPRI